MPSPTTNKPPRTTLLPYTTLFRSCGFGCVMAAEILSGFLVVDVWSWVNFALLQTRSEEHTSELQSHHDLVCRLLLEKKKPDSNTHTKPSPFPITHSRTIDRLYSSS